MRKPPTTVSGSPSVLLVLALTALAVALLTAATGCGPMLPQPPPEPVVSTFTATTVPTDSTSVLLAWTTVDVTEVIFTVDALGHTQTLPVLCSNGPDVATCYGQGSAAVPAPAEVTTFHIQALGPGGSTLAYATWVPQ